MHTPPRGKRRGVDPDLLGKLQFQSTPPRGKRLRLSGSRHTGHRVSIHAPAREATCGSRSASSRRCGCFNPRPRAGSDLAPRAASPLCGTCFNPRPRAGSDQPVRLAHCPPLGLVSIHAPAREATPPKQEPSPRHHVSIHAPAREATRRNPAGRPEEVSIHAPAREATCSDGMGAVRGPVSIHAPAREATRPELLVARIGRVSIHAPAREATRSTGPTPPPPMRAFQSTPPRGKRLSRIALSTCWSAWFQSTPPRGKRPRRLELHPRARRAVSIHAPAREATPAARSSAYDHRFEFQSTPPRGKRLGAEPAPPPVQGRFQSTPPRGKRHHRRPGPPHARHVFQSTPPRGKRRGQLLGHQLGRLLFQSTPPRGKRLGETLTVNAGKRFQSTPPRGKRPGAGPPKETGASASQVHVSIHAPAREATPFRATRRGT